MRTLPSSISAFFTNPSKAMVAALNETNSSWVAWLPYTILFGTLCILLLTATPTYGQSNKSFSRSTQPEQYFDLIWVQGRLWNQPASDSIPIIPGKSGTSFLGAGISVNLWKDQIGLRLQPGISWLTLRYRQQGEKTFPSAGAGLDRETHLITYATLPVGLFGNLSQDRKGRPGVFVEGGGFLSYRISGTYKTRSTDARGQRVIQRVRGIPDVESYQYGLYGQIGYQKAGVRFSYRPSNIFTPYRSRIDNSLSAYRNPQITAYQIGIVLIL